MGKQSKIKQIRSIAKRTISTDVISSLSAEEADNIRTMINRRSVARGGLPALNNMTNFEAFSLGESNVIIRCLFIDRVTRLSEYINRIVSVFLALEGIPEQYALTQLRNSYATFTTPEITLSDHLVLLAKDLNEVLEKYPPIMESFYPGLIEPEPIKDFVRFTLRLSKAVSALMDTEQLDRGASLRETVLSSTYSDVQIVMKHMLDNAKSFGRTKGVSEWKKWLRGEWLRHKTNSPDATDVKIIYLIRNDIAIYRDRVWVLKPEYQADSIRSDAFVSLNNKTATERPDKWRDNLFNDYA